VTRHLIGRHLDLEADPRARLGARGNGDHVSSVTSGTTF